MFVAQSLENGWRYSLGYNGGWNTYRKCQVTLKGQGGVLMSYIYLEANISKTVRDRRLVPKDHQQEVAYC